MYRSSERLNDDVSLVAPQDLTERPSEQITIKKEIYVSLVMCGRHDNEQGDFSGRLFSYIRTCNCIPTEVGFTPGTNLFIPKLKNSYHLMEIQTESTSHIDDTNGIHTANRNLVP